MSTAQKSIFVSTAIPYVNAPPHLGFVLEVLLADVFARHARSRGADVCFASGTDDNSLKNVRAAEAAGLPARAFVDSNAAHYRALAPQIHASFDAFVSTSTDPRHALAVRALWEACARAGDLEKRTYRGLYCLGCEAFYEPADLANGVCPEHGVAPEIVDEDNWFFKLSRYQAPIAEALASGRLHIHPPERAREIERFVATGLHDVSVSRPRARARGWGIEVPGDPGQVVYVWLDALAYYLTAVGHPEDPVSYRRFWADAARRVQVVGKGIARFHAVLWPALLLAAGLPLPTDLWVHGYLTVNGQKIGKSAGNGVDPAAVIARYGVDALRYFLLRYVGPTQDADIDDERLARVYTSDLADALGNLVARTLTLVRRNGDCWNGEGIDPSGEALTARARALEGTVDACVARLAPDDALRAIWAVVAAANKHISDTAPWAVAKARDAASVPAEVGRHAAQLRAILHHAVVAIDAIGRALTPFLPSTAAAIASALANPAAAPPILFPKRGTVPDRPGSVPDRSLDANAR